MGASSSSGGRGGRILLSLVLASIMGGAILFLGQGVAAHLSSGPKKRSQLAEQIDSGLMEQYLPGPDEKETILSWIDDGAVEDDWVEIETVLWENCVLCHDGVIEPNIVPLNQYLTTARVATVRSVLAERTEWGTMTEYLERPVEKETVLRWIENGALESEWAEPGRILVARCASSHNPETGVAGLVSLDLYRPTARIAFVLPSERLSAATVAAPIAALILAAAGMVRLWRKDPG